MNHTLKAIEGYRKLLTSKL